MAKSSIQKKAAKPRKPRTDGKRTGMDLGKGVVWLRGQQELNPKQARQLADYLIRSADYMDAVL